MSEKKILIVEDEASIAEMIEIYLGKYGFAAKKVVSAESALALLERQSFDLILLDLMLPGMDGMDFCKKYRSDAKFKQCPIIMLTARSEDADIVSGLEYGADDYITKPFSLRILLARIKARLREDNAPLKAVSFKGIHLNPDTFEASLAEKPLILTANEFSILHLFLTNPGRVFSRDDIIKHLHGPGYAVTDRAIDVQLVGLRKKIEPLSHLIETVRGVGYKFCK